MLILGAVGLQIRLSDCSTFNGPLNLLLGWICNPTVMSISIFNAKICLRSQILFISALQMLILGAVGLQIRLSECSTFRSTSGRLQSKNVPLDLLLGRICNPTVMSISIFNA